MADDRLSDTETLMWRVEVDPWLQSSFGALSVVEGPIDHELLERKLVTAVAAIPRLRQRITESTSGNPRWRTDGDFDIGQHLRRVGLPSPRDTRTLLDYATRVVADPLDRHRPLWQFHVIEGLPDDRSAVLTKFHHSVTDGEGGVQIALRYMDLEAEPAPAPSLAEAQELLQAVLNAEAIDDPSPGQALAAVVGRQAERLRGVLGEAAMVMADPARVSEQASTAVATLRELGDELPSTEGSPLWRDRSRHRHLEHIALRLEPALEAARGHGGTLNDLLLTAVSAAAGRYHAQQGERLAELQTSFIVSTRGSETEVGNAFTPNLIGLPTTAPTPSDHFAEIATRSAATKEGGPARSRLQDAAAGPARLAPTRLLTSIARRQAARIDLATSNLRSAPVPIWVGGARVLYNVPIGPVAGTAGNVTLMSYADRADVGLHLDPRAISEPRVLRDGLAEAVEALAPNALAD